MAGIFQENGLVLCTGTLNMTKFLAAIFPILLLRITMAQVPLKWSLTIDTIQSPTYYSKKNIVVTSNNKSAVLYSNESRRHDELAFYDANGGLVFKRNFASDSAYMFGLTTDTKRNIYVVGEKTNGGIALGCLVMKFDSTGHLLWKKIWHQYMNPGVEYPVKCLIDHQNNLIITGQTVSTPGNNNDIYVLSYSESGNLNWQYVYNYPVTMSLDVVTDMEIDKDDNIYIGGYTPNTSVNFFSDFTIIKLNKSGVEKWLSKTGYTTLGGLSSYLRSLVLADDGTAYACGFSNNPDSHGIIKSAFVMTKVNPNGQLVWYEVSKIDSQAVAEDIALDKQGHIYVNIISKIDSTYYIFGHPQSQTVKSILRIHKYSKNKQLIWAYQDMAFTQITQTLKVLNDKVAVCSIADNKNKITMLDTSGSFKWQHLHNQPLEIISAPRSEYLDITNEALYATFSSTFQRTMPYVVLNKYEFSTVQDTVPKGLNGKKKRIWWVHNRTVYFNQYVNGTIELFDAEGKLIKTYTLGNVNQQLLPTDIANALYVVRFIPNDNEEYWESKKAVLMD